MIQLLNQLGPGYTVLKQLHNKDIKTMAIVSKITDEMIVKGKGKVDFYKLRGILSVARNWPKRRETPFRPKELEAQGVFGILSKFTTIIQDKVKEAWVVESIGKRPRWQDTFIGLGMKYWGVNKEIPPILIDYQIHWHSPNPELELLLQKIEAKYGKTEAQVIQTTGIISLEEIETYREKLFFSIYDIKGLRLIAPFLEFIIGKNIDFLITLQKLAGFIEEPMKVCFTDAKVRIPKTKTYYYHGVKYECVIEINPKPHKCLPIEKDKGPFGEHVFKIYSGWGSDLIDAKHVMAGKSDTYTYHQVRDIKSSLPDYLVTTSLAIGQGYWYQFEETWEIYRTAIYFKNTELKPDFEIKKAKLNFKVIQRSYHREFKIVVQQGIEESEGVPIYPSQPPLVTDCDRLFYSRNGGEYNTEGMGDPGSRFDLDLKEEGISWINKERNGLTKFLLRSELDIIGIPPYKNFRDRELVTLYSGNIRYNTYRPYLEITVTVYIPEVETRTVIEIEREKVTFVGYIINHHGWLSSFGFEFADYVAGPFEYIEVGKDELQDIQLYMYDKFDLTPDTPYFVRARAENEAGIGRGAWVEFRTLP